MRIVAVQQQAIPDTGSVKIASTKSSNRRQCRHQIPNAPQHVCQHHCHCMTPPAYCWAAMRLTDLSIHQHQSSQSNSSAARSWDPSAMMTLSNAAAANPPNSSSTFDQHRCKHLLPPVLRCSGRHLLPAASRLLLGSLHLSSTTPLQLPSMHPSSRSVAPGLAQEWPTTCLPARLLRRRGSAAAENGADEAAGGALCRLGFLLPLLWRKQGSTLTGGPTGRLLTFASFASLTIYARLASCREPLCDEKNRQRAEVSNRTTGWVGAEGSSVTESPTPPCPACRHIVKGVTKVIPCARRSI